MTAFRRNLQLSLAACALVALAACAPRIAEDPAMLAALERSLTPAVPTPPDTPALPPQVNFSSSVLVGGTVTQGPGLRATSTIRTSGVGGVAQKGAGIQAILGARPMGVTGIQ